jgi:hypothetical protein
MERSCKHDYIDAVDYTWRSRLVGSQTPEMRRLQEFDSESAKSKRMPPDAMQAKTEFLAR